MRIPAIVVILLFICCHSPLMAQQENDSKIFGVTIADPHTDLKELCDALSSHKTKPTARIVFDEWQPATEYKTQISAICHYAYIMGELLDSYYVSKYSVSQYKQRAEEYLKAYSDKVDIWEIGNEINGDWLGKTSEVVQKLEAAYNVVKKYNGKTALTLYMNRDCTYDKPQFEMFRWVNKNISAELKSGLDYVLVSYYEDDCENVILSQNEWQEVFDSLHVIFPDSKLGIGECGTKKKKKKAEYMKRYYSMNITTPGYIGGYFWWYYKSNKQKDCVPKDNKLWSVLDNLSK